MKKTLLFASLLLSLNLHAAQKALTETGEEVILNDDGTWVFANANAKTAGGAITTNEKQFVKPADATFLVKSQVNKTAVWINPKKWKFSKAAKGQASEYEFQREGVDLYALSINEAIEIPVENLVDIALENAKKVAPDARIVAKEYRQVNGKRLIYAQIDGTMQGIKLSYISYYYTDSKGSTQLVTYTGQNLVEQNRADIEDFLNGLVTQ
jgi:hypothetical protein